MKHQDAQRGLRVTKPSAARRHICSAARAANYGPGWRPWQRRLDTVPLQLRGAQVPQRVDLDAIRTEAQVGPCTAASVAQEAPAPPP